jgi:hypothetical protein
LADGGIELREAFPRMHDGERDYHMTYESLGEMADALSSTTPPLLTYERSNVAEPGSIGGRVTLTSAGRSVLAGLLDRVTTCGIDKWLGGVHLEHGARVWRWDDATQHIV